MPPSPRLRPRHEQLRSQAELADLNTWKASYAGRLGLADVTGGFLSFREGTNPCYQRNSRCACADRAIQSRSCGPPARID
jgi:hypothetical protein